jgi:hypothetical protein
MKPVMRALQTIAALQTETRDGPAEAASMWPTERTPLAELEQSSPASCNGRKGRTEVSANSKATADLNRGSATADLNRGSGEPRIAEAKATISEAAFARHREIRIDKRDRVVVAPARGVTRQAVTIITATLLLALALCLGWIGGLNSDFFNIKLPVNKVNSSADPLDAPKSDRLAGQGSSVNTIPTASKSAPETSKRGAQITDSLLTKQTTRAPQPPAVERTKVPTKPAPVPETRPTTIEGWTIREVNGGTAVLEGPNGVWKATRGDTVPGVGKIDSIVRWGNRWIVATSKGLISTR